MKAPPRSPSRSPAPATPPGTEAADLGYDPSRPSKSQRKRDMTALQDLGVELVDLSRERLAELPLPELLQDAILEAQRIKSHEGRRRQLQYIGKLMRTVEAEPIQAQLALWRGTSRAAASALHRLEQWREKLLADDTALDALILEIGPLEPARFTTLRTTIRQARAEQARESPPRHYRELFRLLKELMQAPESAA